MNATIHTRIQPFFWLKGSCWPSSLCASHLLVDWHPAKYPSPKGALNSSRSLRCTFWREPLPKCPFQTHAESKGWLGFGFPPLWWAPTQLYRNRISFGVLLVVHQGLSAVGRRGEGLKGETRMWARVGYSVVDGCALVVIATLAWLGVIRPQRTQPNARPIEAL